MNKIYELIWAEAKELQDLREDEGHARAVTDFAIALCKLLGGDERVVIPAAILHDIGYYGMDKKVLIDLMAGKLSEEHTKKIKEDHMKNGSELAREILMKLNYPQELIGEIRRIIEKHDLDIAPESIEEKIVRDSDKLWRFSKAGFNVDIKRRNCLNSFWHDYLLKNLDKPNYFLTEEARDMAKKELSKRKNEFEKKQSQ